VPISVRYAQVDGSTWSHLGKRSHAEAPGIQIALRYLLVNVEENP
jgi:hypothetical protein